MLHPAAVAGHREGIGAQGGVAPTVMVIIELPAPGAGMVCGLKLTVVPAGIPEADRRIALLKPPSSVVVAVLFPFDPCATAQGGRRNRQDEAGLYRRGHRQRNRGVLLDAAPAAGHRKGIGPHRGAGAHRDGHGRAAAPGAGIGFGLKLTVVPEGTPKPTG